MNNKIITKELKYNNGLKYRFDNNDINNLSNQSKQYLHKIYIKFELPSIYSSSERQFKWIKYLGYNIIKKIICTIKFNDKTTNATSINLYTYSEWLHIWYEINLDASEKELHYDLIGHIPELYDPAYNNNNIYPGSTLINTKYKWIIDDNNLNKATYVTIEKNYNFNKPPSINTKTIYIPLNFSFCNDISNILPLNIISFIDFDITLRDYTELYTVLLQPEDFVLTNNPETNLSITNFNNTFILPEDIIFTNNQKTNFSSNIHMTTTNTTTNTNTNENNISIFDTILNNYRIIPLKKGLSSINRFISRLDWTQQFNNYTSNENTILIVQNIFTTEFFYNTYCKPQILFNIIEKKHSTDNSPKKYININGLCNDINVISLNPGVKSIISSDALTGYITDYNKIINIGGKNNISEIFFIIKHNIRNIKNDFLNYTNYNFNNNKLWNNNINTYFNSFNITDNSIWNNLYTYNDIKFETNSLGRFSIKKKIRDNNIIKFVNIFEYQTNLQNNNNNTEYSYNSHITYNENVLNNFIINIEHDKNKSFNYNNEKQNYNFYNKLSLYKKYKYTIPGLYYLNFTDKNIKNIDNITIKNSDFLSLNIDNQNSYNLLLFCIDNKKIYF